MVNNNSNNGFVNIRKFTGVYFKADISDNCLLVNYDFIKTSNFPNYLVFKGKVYRYTYCFGDHPYFRCVYLPSLLKVSSICRLAVKQELPQIIEYCDEF